MKFSKFIFGPTYKEMQNPAILNSDLHKEAILALKNQDELNPINLYNITWKDENGNVRYIVLPKELTNVKANIIVLIGKNFPSGSHKVGPAYATLMEGEIDHKIDPAQNIIVGPSTGNFGIGTAYISKLKGYKSIVVMPDNMSCERYEYIKKYGGELDLTPGTESDVILSLERVRDYYNKDPKYKVLAQFELLPNYRFHRFVTGKSILSLISKIGNGKIGAFVSAPGSAGTIAAGDEIKKEFSDCKVFAVEPKECSTLFNGGCGIHKIEGIGDKMITLIHNVLTTDYVMLVSEDDCVRALKLFEEAEDLLKFNLQGIFGISGCCNIIAAISAAKFLDLEEDENVVTIATDSSDRYKSVLKKLGTKDNKVFSSWLNEIFLDPKSKDIKDVSVTEEKERLFNMKEKMWKNFGYDKKYLDKMKDMDFWDKEYERIFEIDDRLRNLRGF